MSNIDTGLRALGTAVRTRRGLKRWGQEERAGREGFSGSVLSNVENEVARPQRTTLPKIDRAMDWPVGMSERILTGDVDPIAAAGYEPVMPSPVTAPLPDLEVKPVFTAEEVQQQADVAEVVQQARPLPAAPLERTVRSPSKPRKETTIVIHVPAKTPETLLAAIRAISARVAQAAADELTKGL